MSRKNRAHFHEPTDSSAVDMETPVEDTLEAGALEAGALEVGDVVLIEDPIDGTVEVGTVLLVDGPIDPVPLGAGPSEFGDFNPPRTSAGPMPDFGAAADAAADKAQDLADTVKDKGQDMAQNVTQSAQGLADKAQDIAGKAQDAAHGLTDKAQDAAQDIAGKAQDATQAAADKAKDAAQKIAAGAASAKTAAVSAGTASKGAVAGAAGSVGAGLWSIIQRSPLQAIFFITSLVWLLRNNSATAAQTPVSVTDAAGNAAETVGSISGHVQLAASNLGSQVQAQAQQGAGWFSRTLQENPLVIGAMAIVAGAGLGLAVPETSYEHKALGKTRDQLLDKAQETAQDLGHKVQTVAQTAVQSAIETGKEEAKNQGLTPPEPASPEPAPQEQSQQQ